MSASPRRASPPLAEPRPNEDSEIVRSHATPSLVRAARRIACAAGLSACFGAAAPAGAPSVGEK